jgi:glycosyltransferase involved in cell wall biosynthesis
VKHVLSLATLYPNPANPRFGTFVARSLEALAKRGDWRVTVINPIGLPPLGLGALSTRYRRLEELPEREETGRITILRPRFTLIPKVGARRNAAAIARAALPLARAIDAETRVDLVDAQFFFPDGPAAAEIARALGRPLSIKARGSDITYWGGIDHAREQMAQAADAASGLLAVSEALARDMAAIGLPQDKVTIHYTGLDRDRFRPLAHTQLRPQLGRELGLALPDFAPLFASVGALVERKGHHIAIQALARLSKNHPAACLLIVGKGEEKAALQALVAESGLEGRVHFTGAVDHDIMPLILSAANAMVLPTANEGLANAWVEALACGTPLVTCDVGGARELVTSEVAGQLVERTPEAVAEGMRAVLATKADPEEIAALAARFDWTAHAEELALYYERLTA